MTKFYAATGDHVVRLTLIPNSGWSVKRVLEDAGVQCLAVDHRDPARLYAGTFDNGLLRSRDGGETWEPVGDGIPHGRVLSVTVSPSHRTDGVSAVLAGTEPSSLYRSEDGGDTWEDLASLRDLPSAPTWSFPPRPETSHVRWIAASWFDPDLLFAGIELGGVMRSTDGGTTWEDRKPGSHHDCHAVMMHPKAAESVYEAAGGGAAQSDDMGETWRVVNDGMDRRYVWGLAIDPVDPDLWYVSATHSARYAHGGTNQAEAVIYRRRGDAPWEALRGRLPQPLRSMPYALVTPTERPGEVYAGLRNGAIWHSVDEGDSWNQLNVDLPGIRAMVYVPE